MKFEVGQVLTWNPKVKHEKPAQVTVVALRSRGQAVLSNGWTVDEDGYADGTLRQPGGRVTVP